MIYRFELRPRTAFFKAVFLFYSLMNRIHRTYPDKDFTLLNNAVFKSDLSARAIGLLCFIMSLPRDWVLHKNWIYKKLPEGREAINKAWQELEEKKFIVCIKSTGGGRGKLPETNYFVTDCPQKDVDLSGAEISHSKIPAPKNPVRNSPAPITDTLQSTIEQSTIEQIISVIPDGITEAPPNDPPPAKPKKEKKAKPTPGEKEIGIFQRFTASYDDFFKKLNGVPAQYGKASGAATNSLVAYFRKIARDRATKDAVNDPGESYIDEKAHEGWVYVLNNWARLDGFLQTKTRLIDINSNIQNIITQLKNGHSKKQTGNSGPTGGNVSTASLAHTIAAVYGGTGQR